MHGIFRLRLVETRSSRASRPTWQHSSRLAVQTTFPSFSRVLFIPFDFSHSSLLLTPLQSSFHLHPPLSPPSSVRPHTASYAVLAPHLSLIRALLDEWINQVAPAPTQNAARPAPTRLVAVLLNPVPQQHPLRVVCPSNPDRSEIEISSSDVFGAAGRQNWLASGPFGPFPLPLAGFSLVGAPSRRSVPFRAQDASYWRTTYIVHGAREGGYSTR